MGDWGSDRIYLSAPHVGAEERALLLDAFDSNWIAPLGPHVDGFEADFAEFVGVPHAAALSSGTAALHLALRQLGVGPGDRVATSTLTFVATANAIAYQGAEPVFIDADPATWQMDPALLATYLEDAARSGTLPKAAITVDLYGQCCDYDPILAACEQYGVPVIEDAAEALGATYRGRSAGSFGAAAAFSFNGNKIITTSGGGMLVSHDEAVVTRARFLATQARDPAPHYEHSEVGFNYRLSNLLAAVGRGQLRGLPPKIERRHEINATYRAELGNLPGVSFMPFADYGRPNAWLTCATIDPTEAGATRADILAHLGGQSIEARTVWKPMHLQPLFKGATHIGGAVSEDLFTTGLCLPSGSSLTDAQQDRIVTETRKVLA